LFSKPSIHKKEYRSKNYNSGESSHMLTHRLSNYFFQLIYTNNISQESICNQEADKPEYNPFGKLLNDLLCIPWSFIQHFLSWRIPFNPVFNLSEYHFHKDSLRASPTTEDTSKNQRKQSYKHNKHHHSQTENEKILWPEYLSKQDKFPFDNI